MENKAHALAAGIFVVVMTALVLVLAAWLTRDTGVRHLYEIATRETVTGLQAQAPVRYRGVDVGKVSSIGFDPKVQGQVLVRMEIDQEAPMTKDTVATLSFQGVTGLAFVQLKDSGKPSPRLEPNDEVPPRIPLEPGFLTKLEARGDAILDKVEELGTRLNQVLNDSNQKQLAVAITNIGSAAGSTEKLARTIDTTIRERLDPALTQATTAMKSVDVTVQEFGRAATDVRATAQEFTATAKRLNAPDGPIDRLAEGTQALSQAAESFNAATLPRINRVTEDAGRAVRQLGRTARSIDENPQSLIFGEGKVQPGPGEPGFTPPGGR